MGITLWHVNSDFEFEASETVGSSYTLEEVDIRTDIVLEDIPQSVSESGYPPPPPPSEVWPRHSILKQRSATRNVGVKHKINRSGANRFDDYEKQESYRRTACNRERIRMKDMNRSFDQLRQRVPFPHRKGKRV